MSEKSTYDIQKTEDEDKFIIFLASHNDNHRFPLKLLDYEGDVEKASELIASFTRGVTDLLERLTRMNQLPKGFKIPTLKIIKKSDSVQTETKFTGDPETKTLAILSQEITIPLTLLDVFSPVSNDQFVGVNSVQGQLVFAASPKDIFYLYGIEECMHAIEAWKNPYKTLEQSKNSKLISAEEYDAQDREFTAQLMQKILAKEKNINPDTIKVIQQRIDNAKKFREEQRAKKGGTGL